MVDVDILLSILSRIVVCTSGSFLIDWISVLRDSPDLVFALILMLFVVRARLVVVISCGIRSVISKNNPTFLFEEDASSDANESRS